ncbi:TPA: tRNA-dihydrouridine synthase [Campylobacter fetus subsp. venerealis]|nr:tRNA-dihydrouridine synthase [Campylobacter fetus subsp. venerealis]
MSSLFKSLKLANFTIPNRITMPPMCVYRSRDLQGLPRCFHRLHYPARSLGGVGFIIVEATAVSPEGCISKNDIGLWSDIQVEAHKKLNYEIKKYSCKVTSVQLAHAGAKGTCDGIISPSGVRFSGEYGTPDILNTQEIYSIVTKFKEAAIRAKDSDYDLIEIHGAHGYLINQFLSPLTNKREDEFGGNLENRMRFLNLIIEELKDIIPFGVRLSADEWEDGGNTTEDIKIVAKKCEELGASYISVSAGGVVENPTHMPKIKPLYQAQYAKDIKEVINIPVIAAGLITTKEQGEYLLDNGFCDLVAYGRELLRNPNFALYAAASTGLNDLIDFSYKKAF